MSKVFALDDPVLIFQIVWPKSAEKFHHHFIPVIRTGVDGLDIVSDLHHLFLNYELWYGTELTFESLLFPIQNRRGFLVIMTTHCMEAYDASFAKFAKWPAFTLYARKRGLVSEAFLNTNFSEYELCMIGRHTRTFESIGSIIDWSF